MEPNVKTEAPASKKVPCPVSFKLDRWTSKAGVKSLWLVLEKNGTEMMRLSAKQVEELIPALNNPIYGEVVSEKLREAAIALMAKRGGARSQSETLATF